MDIETNFHIDYHISHLCNLSCESCNHLTNSKHNKILTLKEIENDFLLWYKKIQPCSIHLLGGEPLLNPQIYEILELIRNYFKNSNIKLLTNGLLLHKYPNLPIYLKNNNIFLKISLHGHNLNENLELVNQWVNKYDIKYDVIDNTKIWSKRYNGIDNLIRPFHNENNPKKSYSVCWDVSCKQLYDGKLWKCPIVTYYQLQKIKYPEIKQYWKEFDMYQPLSSNCSNDELKKFLSTKEELCCGLCPTIENKIKPKSTLNFI